MPGKFITFEGGDGAGKSTQIKRLAERLRDAGVVVVTTGEPGGTPIAMGIRTLLLSGAVRGLGPDAETLLFNAARADHVHRVIRPALARGDWVLCDRFMDSTRAYQGTAGVSDETMDAWERQAVGPTRPDLTILLDVPPEVGLARVASRERGIDRFEGDPLELHRRRREAFLAIAAAEPERVVVIDGTKSTDAVSEANWRAVETRLLGRR